MLAQSVNRKLEGKVIGFKDKKKELEGSWQINLLIIGTFMWVLLKLMTVFGIPRGYIFRKKWIEWYKSKK